MLVCKIVVTTKIPEDSSLSCNGGDYYEGYTIRGYRRSRKSRPVFTYRDWSSNELVEYGVAETVISHKEVRKLLSSFVGDFKTILRSPLYVEGLFDLEERHLDAR